MTARSWDRVGIDAQSVDAPLSRAAIFLVVTAYAFANLILFFKPSDPVAKPPEEQPKS